MKKTRSAISGVTLIEVLLVTAIISAFLVLIASYVDQKILQTKITKTANNMKQVLNAAVAYYLVNGQWPPTGGNLNCLQGLSGCLVAYLPKNIIDPFKGYNYSMSSTPGQFSVGVIIDPGKPKTYSYVLSILALLPAAYAVDQMDYTTPCNANSDWCILTATVPVPPIQSSNNATGVNFAAVYHNGACVPVPVCPSDGTVNSMIASIVVTPTGVTGAAKKPLAPGTNVPGCNPTTQSGCSIEAFPISGYSATATPPAFPDGSASGATSGPYSCKTASTATPVPEPCYQDYDATGAPVGLPLKGKQYWRVCLNIVTEAGVVVPDDNTWGQLTGTIMAITRCIKPGEKTGSQFSVWSQ